MDDVAGHSAAAQERRSYALRGGVRGYVRSVYPARFSECARRQTQRTPVHAMLDSHSHRSLFIS